MGKIKQAEDDTKTYYLNEREWVMLQTMNMALQYSTLRDKVMSQFIYYVLISRFGYDEGEDLIFQVDMESDKRELKIRKAPPREQVAIE